MNRLLLALFLLLHINAFAQPEYFNTEAFWSRLQYDTSSISLNTIETDTTIIVVSNRQKSNDSLRFMSEYPTDGALSYFIVYSYKGKWHVRPLNSLKQAIEAMPDNNRDWVIYTEGMGKLFTSELDRGMNMAAQYDVNVIMLDYPSITTTKKTSGNYLFAVKQSKATYKYFSPIIAQIKELYISQQMGSGKVSLFFHSMGNNLAKQIVKKKTYKLFNGEKWISNIILNSACVPQSRHTKWLNQINFAQSIYIHYNPDDFVLGAAHVVSKRKQLGEKIKHPISNKAYYINFSKIVGQAHSYFLELHKHNDVSKEVRAHYNTVLHGDNVDFDKAMYQKTDYKNIGWDIVTTN